jgi:hypothetical protein
VWRGQRAAAPTECEAITQRLQPITERWDPSSKRAGDEHPQRPATVMSETISSRERRSDSGTTTRARWAIRQRRWNSGPKRLRLAGSDYGATTADYGTTTFPKGGDSRFSNSGLRWGRERVLSKRDRRRSQPNGEWMSNCREKQGEDSQRRQQPVQRAAWSKAVAEGGGSDYERNGSDYGRIAI